MVAPTALRGPGRAAALLLPAAVVVRVGVPALQPAPERRDFDGLLTWAAGWLLIAVATWSAVLAIALLLSCRARTGLAGRWLLALCCPRPWRTALLVSVGAASVTAGVTPAHAESWRPPSLDRPADSAAAARPAPDLRVTVRAGDSLWSLMRSRFPTADDPTLAVLVRRTYAANRAAIGPDPDLLHPGEQLRMPDARSHDDR